jgi:hypothetical protein
MLGEFETMKPITRISNANRWRLLPLLLVGLTTGCSDEPFSMKKVSGQITFEDGTPLPEGVWVWFYSLTPPIDAKTHPRPGVAYPDGHGKFDFVTSHKWGDGLVVGKHKVVIATNQRGAVPAGVPREYNDENKTPLEVDTADAPFDIKVRKK